MAVETMLDAQINLSIPLVSYPVTGTSVRAPVYADGKVIEDEDYRDNLMKKFDAWRGKMALLQLKAALFADAIESNIPAFDAFKEVIYDFVETPFYCEDPKYHDLHGKLNKATENLGNVVIASVRNCYIER